MKDRTYIAIDLKSFYASVECRERGLDPLDTNLVVADESRTDKTICLAVTPSLKSYGISGRGRLFEVKQRVKEANAGRQHDAPGRRLDGTSHFFSELQANPSLAIDFIIAPPRMAYYMESVSYTHLADCLFQLFELRTIEGNAAVPVIHKRLTDQLQILMSVSYTHLDVYKRQAPA